MKNKPQVSILGATGHIAKSILFEMYSRQDLHFNLFSRNTTKMLDFINTQRLDIYNNITNINLDEFNNYEHDIIINCIGIGNPAHLKYDPTVVFKITEQFDNLILDYLKKNKDTLYIYLSSGAVYGTEFNAPTHNNSLNSININNVTFKDYYSISKVYTEVKHRAFSDRNIVDLRIFGFVSQFADLQAPYFLNELINSVVENKLFITTPTNIIRDYIAPSDLVSVINKMISKKRINEAYDVYSLAPVSKFEILEHFVQRYNLTYKIKEEGIMSPTGQKDFYYSTNYKLGELGYTPRFSSLKVLEMVIDDLLR